MYLVKSPLLLKWFYSSLIWNKPRKDKTVYLTFDDGPIPNVTDFVLNTLKSYNIKATFFCIGDNITKHPAIFEQLKKDGHAIGNHTYNHLKGWDTDDNTYIQNFLKCQKLTQTNLFRPPYGRIKKSQIKKLSSVFSSQFSVNDLPTGDPELQIIMWDLLSGDFDTQLSPEKCYQNVVKNVRNGSIIVFHDSLKAFDRVQHALPLAIKYLIDKGYQFRTL
jgi:peptidoglycan/xylan/chitin deacetylase (PgdA/CDA1 family)